jgi:dinuclear metal center YbgI/SA1388 family protein
MRCTSSSFFTEQHVPTVQDFLVTLQQITPEHLAEDWDNIGLLIGDPGQTVHHVLVALDPTNALIEQAHVSGYDLVITHHPVIFRPVKAIRTDTPLGHFIQVATRNNISVIACHTNLDSIQGGISDHLASALGLVDSRPLLAARKGCDPACGLGRIGIYRSHLSPDAFLVRIRQACSPTWILEAGTRPEQVTTVAVCGGSCSDFAEIALQQGADVFLTAEVKHSVACWAADAGLWMLDAGHFATEYPAMMLFRDTLRQQASDQNWEVTIDIAIQQAPLRLA